jgi:hypothetical protein
MRVLLLYDRSILTLLRGFSERWRRAFDGIPEYNKNTGTGRKNTGTGRKYYLNKLNSLVK